MHPLCRQKSQVGLVNRNQIVNLLLQLLQLQNGRHPISLNRVHGVRRLLQEAVGVDNILVHATEHLFEGVNLSAHGDAVVPREIELRVDE